MCAGRRGRIIDAMRAIAIARRSGPPTPAALRSPMRAALLALARSSCCRPPRRRRRSTCRAFRGRAAGGEGEHRRAGAAAPAVPERPRRTFPAAVRAPTATRSASPPRGTAAARPPASSPTSAPSAARSRTTRARSELAGGRTGYFKPLTCGASCSPPVIEWMEDDVLYWIQAHAGTRKQEKKRLRRMANSRLPHGAR